MKSIRRVAFDTALAFQVNFRIADHPFFIGNVLSAPRRAY